VATVEVERAPGSQGDGAGEELPKTMGWLDGVAFGVCAPGSAFASIGFSVVALGGWWSTAIWVFATAVAITAARLYAELASMFPKKSGGIAMYAEEGWRPYSTLVGPLATWGYWVAWSAAGAVFAVTIAAALQAEFFASQDWTVDAGLTTLTFGKLLAAAILVGCFLVNLRGARFTARWGVATGVITVLVLLMMSVVPFLTGDVDLDRVGGHLDASGFDAVRVVMVWFFVMFWTIGGLELAASFTPEFRNGWRDTRKALVVVGAISVVCLGLMPIAVTGVLGEEAIAANPGNFMVAVFNEVLPVASWVPTLLLCAVFLLVILAGDADGSRTLYGMSHDRMTLRQFGHLNRRNAPSRALTTSLVFNLFLVLFVSNSLAIIAAANLGYTLAHFFAVSGFLLLRRDRPDWPRPDRVPSAWLPAAGVVAVILLVAVLLGATGFSVTGYGGTKELIIGIVVLSVAWLFFFARRLGQDREPIEWREPAPRVPEDVTPSRV
jgi:amino acid transporter